VIVLVLIVLVFTTAKVQTFTVINLSKILH